jgi:hypothetical protein
MTLSWCRGVGGSTVAAVDDKLVAVKRMVAAHSSSRRLPVGARMHAVRMRWSRLLRTLSRRRLTTGTAKGRDEQLPRVTAKPCVELAAHTSAIVAGVVVSKSRSQPTVVTALAAAQA